MELRGDPELLALYQQHLRQMTVLRLELERERTAAELMRIKVGRCEACHGAGQWEACHGAGQWEACHGAEY